MKVEYTKNICDVCHKKECTTFDRKININGLVFDVCDKCQNKLSEVLMFLDTGTNVSVHYVWLKSDDEESKEKYMEIAKDDPLIKALLNQF